MVRKGCESSIHDDDIDLCVSMMGWVDLPYIDWVDFRRRRAVDISSLIFNSTIVMVHLIKINCLYFLKDTMFVHVIISCPESTLNIILLCWSYLKTKYLGKIVNFNICFMGHGILKAISWLPLSSWSGNGDIGAYRDWTWCPHGAEHNWLVKLSQLRWLLGCYHGIISEIGSRICFTSTEFMTGRKVWHI